MQAALHYKEPIKLPNSCPYKLSFTQLWKIPWKCFPLLLWKRACASFVPPPGFLASQPGLDKFLARAARSGCFGEELESSSSCILTVRKWNWRLFKLRQKIRTKGLAVCTLCTHLSHPIQMIHPLHSEQTKYAWCSKKCKMCGHVRRFKRCCLFKGILHQKNFYHLNLIFWLIMGCGIAHFGRRGLKTTETWKFWSQILSPGVLRRSAPGVSRHSAMGFGGAAHW